MTNVVGYTKAGADAAIAAAVNAEKVRAQAAEATSTTSVAAETTRALAAEATAVHQTGNETVSGTKAFTSSPTVPTPSPLDNSSKAANTSYVDSAVAVEKTRALAAEGTNATNIAANSTAISTETSRAQAAEALLAPKASPAFSGTPTTPTPSALDNSTKIASTAYVDGAIATQHTTDTATFALVNVVDQTIHTSAFSAVADTIHTCDSTSGTLVVTLPTAPADRTVVSVKDVASVPVGVTINCGGSDVFDKPSGATTGTLKISGQSKTWQYDGTRHIWVTISDDLPLSQLDARYAPIIGGAYAVIVKMTGNAATDTANIQAALNAGGRVLIYGPLGTYAVNPLQIKSNAHLDLGGCTLQLAAASNADLMTTPNFASLTQTASQGGESIWSITNGILDGNGASQTSGTSFTLRIFAKAYVLRGLRVINGYSGNFWTEWGDNGADMEAFVSDCKFHDNVGGTNVQNYGPHDLVWDNVIMYHAGPSGSPGLNYVGGIAPGSVAVNGASGTVLKGCHAFGWGTVGMTWNVAHIWDGSTSEGHTKNLIVGAYNCVVSGGQIFGTNASGETGVAFANSAKYLKMTGVLMWKFGSGSSLFDFTNSGTHHDIEVSTILGSAAIQGAGTYTASVDRFICRALDAPASSVASDPGALAYRGSGGLSLQGPLIQKNSSGSTTVAAVNTDGSVQPGSNSGTGARLYSGSGAPSFSANAGSFYFRLDTPSTANQRLYINTSSGSGTTWTAIL